MEGKRNKYKRALLIITVEFFLGAIFLYLLINFFLRISFQDAMPLIIIGIIGFLVGSVYYLRSIKRKW